MHFISKDNLNIFAELGALLAIPDVVFFKIINLCVLCAHQRTGVMGVMQKVNPFKSSSQVKQVNMNLFAII